MEYLHGRRFIVMELEIWPPRSHVKTLYSIKRVVVKHVLNSQTISLCDQSKRQRRTRL